jgi:holo-[acyl-carrier protein] synthase
MIDGIGVDIIETERIGRAIQNPRFVARVFTAHEAQECSTRGRPDQRFAGRFAAKEAIIKALGRRFLWKEMEIRNGVRGEPYALLSGGARECLGTRRLLISISHCHAYSVAQAILVAEEFSL